MRITILRRLVQGISLLLFCFSLWLLRDDGLWQDIGSCFLRLDPLAGLAIPLSVQTFTLWPVVLVYLSALFFGRVFCGWICPMGATLDALGTLARLGVKGKARAGARFGKYVLLAALLTAALFGLNLVFWASPLPLTARLYALVLYPLVEYGTERTLPLLTPLAEQLQYWQLEAHTFSTAWFVAFFWLVCVALERFAPRFWCRYLCPAGALLGILARIAPWRRHVNAQACVACGRCARSCPTGICSPMPKDTAIAECIACRRCEQDCPKRAISFGLTRTASSLPTQTLLSRRTFCTSLAAGTILGTLPGILAKDKTRTILRPPGSVPEEHFLALCLRCGACLRACPTGGLQPLWLEHGSLALFSPHLDPRVGPCRPECTACGHVCPTKAILPLPLAEKQWAKIGTAVLSRTSCLAWAEHKRCMVCKENCPYAAIEVEVLRGQTAPVPQVRAESCYGCGYCEKYCPVSPPAITVTPKGALRQSSEDFQREAKARGLKLQIGTSTTEVRPQEGPPPGFLE